MDAGTVLSAIALALASFALGMRIGRVLTLWEEKSKNCDYQSDESHS